MWFLCFLFRLLVFSSSPVLSAGRSLKLGVSTETFFSLILDFERERVIDNLIAQVS
jgi:hypothetical protein